MFTLETNQINITHDVDTISFQIQNEDFLSEYKKKYPGFPNSFNCQKISKDSIFNYFLRLYETNKVAVKEKNDSIDFFFKDNMSDLVGVFIDFYQIEAIPRTTIVSISPSFNLISPIDYHAKRFSYPLVFNQKVIRQTIMHELSHLVHFNMLNIDTLTMGSYSMDRTELAICEIFTIFFMTDNAVVKLLGPYCLDQHILPQNIIDELYALFRIYHYQKKETLFSSYQLIKKHIIEGRYLTCQ